MKASLAVFEAQEDEPLKQQNAQLQQRTIKQQEQLRELQLKLKKTKEVSEIESFRGDYFGSHFFLFCIVCHTTRQNVEGIKTERHKWEL
jgi:hypothetical protein